jgi:RimJ/RimL family protein N-acetyltransferase
MSHDAARAFLNEMNVAEALLPGEWFQIGIAATDSNLLIGDIGVCVSKEETEAEIGFTLGRTSQGRGLATEAAAKAIEVVFGFTAVRRVVAIADARNAAAMKLLLALGMQRAETKQAIFRGEPCIEHTFVLARPSGAQPVGQPEVREQAAPLPDPWLRQTLGPSIRRSHTPMLKAEFLTVEGGKDLLVSFALAPHAHRSLTLLRTPEYEFILPVEERGVSVAYGATGGERDLLDWIKWKPGSVEIKTLRDRYEIDIRSVDSKEIVAAKKMFRRMVKGIAARIEEP